jgi:hypothetical protein
MIIIAGLILLPLVYLAIDALAFFFEMGGR